MPAEWTGQRLPLFTDGPVEGWVVEHSSRADGRVAEARAVGGTQITLRYALGGSRADSPFVALARRLDTPPVGYEALLFEARASRPMRISAQLRERDGANPRRWRRSVFLDPGNRRVVLPLLLIMRKPIIPSS